jgi:hypothetical protein
MYKNSRNRVLVRFNRGRLTYCRPLADEIRETRSTKATRKRSKGIRTANDGLPGSCRNDDPVPSLRSLLPLTGRASWPGTVRTTGAARRHGRRGRRRQQGRRSGVDDGHCELAGDGPDNGGGAAARMTGAPQTTGMARRCGRRALRI